ncbi:MAG: hypothetical protein VW999_09080 [Alphaproteobacteria bacterium]|jgi:hypothetical protein
MSDDELVRTLIESFSGYRVNPESAKRIASENKAVRQGLENSAQSLADVQPANYENVLDNGAPK